jgi:hypothetical protein
MEKRGIACEPYIQSWDLYSLKTYELQTQYMFYKTEHFIFVTDISNTRGSACWKDGGEEWAWGVDIKSFRDQ